jgi:hypothetical protein
MNVGYNLTVFDFGVGRAWDGMPSLHLFSDNESQHEK